MRFGVVHRRTELAATAAERPLVLRGDDTGAATLLVYVDATRLAVFDDWTVAVRTLEAADLLHIDSGGCQFFLAYGLVPPPYTLYRDLYRLGVGDRLAIDLAGGRVAFTVDYPYFEAGSRGDAGYDPRRLRRLLAEAVSRALPPGVPALLMQSAGKDSAGLLVGIAEAGRGADVRAATYDPGYREQEAGPAAELARRFGIRHGAVAGDPRAEFDSWLRFAETAPAVCADLASFAYLHVLERHGVRAGVVLDGLGNDAYMGYAEPRRDAALGSLALARWLPAAWGRWEPPQVGARLAYLWKTALMYPAERCLAGSRLAPSTVLRLLPVATPFRDHFARLDRDRRRLSPIDFRGYVRGRIFDGAMTMAKGRLAAASHGARAVYPYCDQALIDYCFHLPLADRYDARRRRNKVALRRLLEHDVGDAPYLRRKGSFRFDVVRFVAANERGIRDELAAAHPFLRELDRWAAFLLRRKSNYVHAYELVTLFMLASWLARRPAPVVRPLRELEPASPGVAITIEP